MRLSKSSVLLVLVLALTAAVPVQAVEIDYRIENLTNGISFRPFLLAAHPAASPMFRTGQPASDFPGIQGMAECGGLEPELADRMAGVGAEMVVDPVTMTKPADPPLGLLFPAGITEADTDLFPNGIPGMVSGTLTVTDPANNRLSLVAMLLPTNDAFVGLDSWPLEEGVHVLHLSAYDAGTEANDEVVADDDPLDCVVDEPGYPTDPLGNDGTGAAVTIGPDTSPAIHVHRGNVGDSNATGGFSNLDAAIHRWQNPVVKLVIRVRR